MHEQLFSEEMLDTGDNDDNDHFWPDNNGMCIFTSYQIVKKY